MKEFTEQELALLKRYRRLGKATARGLVTLERRMNAWALLILGVFGVIASLTAMGRILAGDDEIMPFVCSQRFLDCSNIYASLLISLITGIVFLIIVIVGIVVSLVVIGTIIRFIIDWLKDYKALSKLDQ